MKDMKGNTAHALDWCLSLSESCKRICKREQVQACGKAWSSGGGRMLSLVEEEAGFMVWDETLVKANPTP